MPTAVQLGKKKQFAFILDIPLGRRIQKEAKLQKRFPAHLVTQALEEYFERLERQRKAGAG